jgi:hypothetical protein
LGYLVHVPRRKLAMPFRGIIDYSYAIAKISERPGIWFRVFVGEYRDCLTVAASLKRKGAVAKVKSMNGDSKVLALWPDWDYG